ncbi:MAG: hypothetical protein LRS47_02170 [Desulfurococcales archaeon]|nr:hypothetical protein [Desulfurococcales archaeon]
MSYRDNRDMRDYRRRDERRPGHQRDRQGYRPRGHGGYQPRHAPREKRQDQRQGKPMPKPAGDMCNPLCPYFRCSKKALLITTEHYRGQPIKEAYCRWIGDKCIGAQCQYAYCALQKMLPDGRCGWALERRQQSRREFEEELESDDLGLRSRNLLSKLGFKDEEF